MHLEHNQKDIEFIKEVQTFLDENLPENLRHKYATLEHSDPEIVLWWQSVLAKKGWLVPAWPVEYGGTGWALGQRLIFKQELEKAGAPITSPFGVVMVGPVIYTFGNTWQKSRFLPGIRNGTEIWCQGYSEPGSGSDLASLATRAVRDGDHYVVNGQKIWTTFAHVADWIFCLVRTNTQNKPQEGISFLLIDMTSPGIEVRPIVTIDGLHHLNEIYFTDVRVPVQNLVGEENQGWTYAKFLLENERTDAANSAQTRVSFERLKRLYLATIDQFNPDNSDQSFLDRLSALDIRLSALEITEARAMTAQPGSADEVRLSMPLKLIGTQLQQDVTEMYVEMFGQLAASTESDRAEGGNVHEPRHEEEVSHFVQSYFFGRAATIYGGTSEIQKNIMAKMLLQL